MNGPLTKEYLLSVLNGDDLLIANEAEAPGEIIGDESTYSDIQPVVPQSSSESSSPTSSTENGQQIKNREPVKFRDLAEFIEVMTTAPTHTPKNINDQIKYCTADSKLYFYDTINKTWKKSAAFT